MRKFVSCLSCILLLSTPIILPKAGDLDPTFGFGEGFVTTNIGANNDHWRNVAIQHNGKIITVGRDQGSGGADAIIGRYNQDGSLDVSFADNGLKIITTGGYDRFNAALIQSDQKIVVIGQGSASEIIVARLNPDGSFDTTFNPDGVGLAPSMPGLLILRLAPVAADTDPVYAGALQSDGKIVMVGQFQQVGEGSNFLVVRLNPDGTLDSSFNPNAGGDAPNAAPGWVVTDLGGTTDTAVSIAIQKCDGKIIAGGFSNAGEESGNNKVALVRYNTNGTIDTSFGTDGIVLTVAGDTSSVRSIALQQDRKIVIAGSGGYDVDINSFLIIRYNPNGSIDTSFNTTGSVLIAELDRGFNIAIQPDGKIVAGGEGDDRSFALVRRNLDGTPDSTFGRNGLGYVTTPFINTTELMTGMTLQPDGRFVMVGSILVNETAQAVVIRFLGDTLSVTKEASTDNPCPGQNITYTITVKNTGASGGTVNDIYIEDKFPEGINFRYVKTSGQTSSFDPSTKIWHIPSLCTGEYAQLKIKARVHTLNGLEVFCNTAVTTFSSVDEVTNSSLFESLGYSGTEIFSTTACVLSQPLVCENMFDVIKRTDCGIDDLQDDIYKIQQQQGEILSKLQQIQNCLNNS